MCKKCILFILRLRFSVRLANRRGWLEIVSAGIKRRTPNRPCTATKEARRQNKQQPLESKAGRGRPAGLPKAGEGTGEGRIQQH